MKKFKNVILVVFCLFAIFSGLKVAAQDQECRVLKAFPKGSYLVEIDGKTFMAITEEQEKKILKLKRDVLDARGEIALKDSLLASYEQVRAWYDTTLSQQKEYIAELENVLKGYKNLVQGYKKLKKEPWLTFEGGIGATGDTNPAVFFGLGIRRFRVYGFLQESNAGALLGLSYPLF